MTFCSKLPSVLHEAPASEVLTIPLSLYPVFIATFLDQRCALFNLCSYFTPRFVVCQYVFSYFLCININSHLIFL